ncbi:ROK family transcriptional regulator [Streptomyces sp. NBC_01218]|uniref:ROK family transcriptional regulator n=1 Tax=unclassified Streptomyces TaxID=2593676 RepID=UPI0023B8ED8B|nr:MULTISPECIES: ROK family transcriptional regulator [unclassified Streptomyces]WEH40179.1 ROK family transcriptional regulator [Streptomyces sp. AM 2-1-1]WSQ51873.1 ROK family transcriptional regulator [Streptomyces sp. NBC_01218]
MAGNQASAGHLLRLIRSGEATTRGELQQATGLSRSTVGHRLDQLFGAGWLRGAAGTSTGGRPSARLEFDPTHAVVLVADLETRHGRAAVVDLAGKVLAERTGSLLVTDGPDVVLDRIARWFGPLLEEAGTPPARVCGVGLSVPGPVDWDSAQVVQPPIMPGWDRFPVRERLRTALAEHLGPPGPGALGGAEPLPVYVDNDANLMALAEQRENYADCGAFVLVKASTGIGAGMVVGGEMYRGIDGGAGDIGHIRLHDRPDALCMCGSYGCLAAVASGRAIAEQLTAAGVPTASGSDVRRHLAAGQPDAVRLARAAGQRVGEVLVTVVTLLNPGVLMLGGDLASTPFLTGVRELLYQRALPRTTAHLQVVTTTLGDRAALAGAAVMVVERLYDPDRADARLAASANAGGGTAG